MGRTRNNNRVRDASDGHIAVDEAHVSCRRLGTSLEVGNRGKMKILRAESPVIRTSTMRRIKTVDCNSAIIHLLGKVKIFKTFGMRY